jgi:hypothetical protein
MYKLTVCLTIIWVWLVFPPNDGRKLVIMSWTTTQSKLQEPKKIVNKTNKEKKYWNLSEPVQIKKLSCFMTSYLKDHEIFNILRGSFLNFKKPCKKSSDAFEILFVIYTFLYVACLYCVKNWISDLNIEKVVLAIKCQNV